MSFSTLSVYEMENKVIAAVEKWADAEDLRAIENRGDDFEISDAQCSAIDDIRDNRIPELVENLTDPLNYDELLEIANEERELFSANPDDAGYGCSAADLVKYALVERLTEVGRDQLDEIQNEEPAIQLQG